MPSKVLVVEDDPTLCDFIQEVLSSEEVEAHGLTNSAQARARLRAEKFDAVFLDLRMPPPDGIELALEMRASKLNRTTPIVMITGEQERGLMTRAFQAGATFFLSKPVDRTRLLRLIRATRGSMEHEKQRFRRVKLRCKVSIESKQGRLEGTTLDLSLHGMLVEARYVLPLGSLVQVNLELSPAKPPVRLAARVVRLIGNDCMGLRIENAGEAETAQFEEFLLPLISADG